MGKNFTEYLPCTCCRGPRPGVLTCLCLAGKDNESHSSSELSRDLRAFVSALQLGLPRPWPAGLVFLLGWLKLPGGLQEGSPGLLLPGGWGWEGGVLTGVGCRTPGSPAHPCTLASPHGPWAPPPLPARPILWPPEATGAGHAFPLGTRVFTFLPQTASRSSPVPSASRAFIRPCVCFSCVGFEMISLNKV